MLTVARQALCCSLPWSPLASHLPSGSATVGKLENLEGGAARQPQKQGSSAPANAWALPGKPCAAFREWLPQPTASERSVLNFKEKKADSAVLPDRGL